MADEKKDELLPVEDTELQGREAQVVDDDNDHDEDDSPDDEGTEQPEAKAGEDARAGHAEGEAEGEDAAATTKRQERQARKQRQREARERSEKEMRFLRQRNEQLERRFSAVEANQRKLVTNNIDTQITDIQAQIAEAREIEAAAIEAAEGADAVEAREIREELENRLGRLNAQKEKLSKAPAASEAQVPAHAAMAIGWIKRNKTWYKPTGMDEPSVIARSIEASLLDQGFNPRTEEYWEKLDERLRVRLPEVFESAGTDRRERTEERAAPAAKGTKEPPARKAGGPVVTVGGAQRHLKANEVYVSPDRKAAMMEAGVWDDPVLRNRMLKQYRQWDQEHAN